MDFRSNQQPAAHPATPVVASGTTNAKRSPDDNPGTKWSRLLSFVILLSVAVIIAAVAFAFTRGSSANEFKFVSSSKYQAVFLNNGQVYFGKIASLNGKYVDLRDVYYLTQNTSTDAKGQTTTSNNYTLTQLGCQQIHYPAAQMLINRDQVTFWENLQDKGTVVTKINELKKNYPNGVDCSAVSSQTQASSTNTQGSTTPSTKP